MPRLTEKTACSAQPVKKYSQKLAHERCYILRFLQQTLDTLRHARAIFFSDSSSPKVSFFPANFCCVECMTLPGFLKMFRQFPNIAEDIQRFPMIAKDSPQYVQTQFGGFKHDMVSFIVLSKLNQIYIPISDITIIIISSNIHVTPCYVTYVLVGINI